MASKPNPTNTRWGGDHRLTSTPNVLCHQLSTANVPAWRTPQAPTRSRAGRARPRVVLMSRPGQ